MPKKACLARMVLFLPALISLSLSLFCTGSDGSAPAVQAVDSSRNIPLQKVRLPEGFKISVFAADVPHARSMVRGDNGTIFVGSREDRVFAIEDSNQDGRAERVHTIARGLNSPNGVAFRDGSLYVAEISRITRYDNIEAQLADPPPPALVNDSYPSDEHHGWKYIRFGPDGWLYVPVGAPCNVCLRKDRRYAAMTRIKPDGSGLEIFAEGIRNTVGFDWHPATRELWFTDNGRDMLGDDVPPDELNRAPQAGLHFGFPFCQGGDIKDPEFGSQKPCSQFVPPVQKLGPHVAALGMRFYTGSMFPDEYKNQILIAEHGSWNRSVPIGYRLTLVRLEGNRAIDYKVFAEGWLEGDDAWGRPVDLLILPDGSLLVSDDELGVVYRITYAQ